MNSNESKLVGMGAECVCGDLILDRQTVGRYRNGDFLITTEGLAALSDVIDVEATEVTEAQDPAPVRAPRRKRNAETGELEAAAE